MIRSEIQAQIETIVNGVPNTASKVRNVLGILANGTSQTGDIKEIDVPTSYIASNFDPTGLGINERLGWAICNGNNGTRDRRGRISMQYSDTYPTLGSKGGSYDAVLVSHNHKMGDQSGPSGSGTLNARFLGREIEVNSLGIPYTDYSGESGINKNMQPYIVTLMIQKL